MNEQSTFGSTGIPIYPEDLNGHSLEELSDYLDAGSTPANPSIDNSPECQLAIDALKRLRSLTTQLFRADINAEPAPNDSWVHNILAGITLESRAGRRIPITIDAPHTDLGLTEGAVRGIIRATENNVPGVLVGRCYFDGDVTAPGEPVRIRIDVSVPYGPPIPDFVTALRAEIASSLSVHTTLNLAGIDITVHDVHYPDPTIKGTS